MTSERTAIVDWLRGHAKHHALAGHSTAAHELEEKANGIERGEHMPKVGTAKQAENMAARLRESPENTARRILAANPRGPEPLIMGPQAPPVDRSARVVLGEAMAPGIANTEDRGDGQQKGYVVLSDAERAKGFVRPVRCKYIHVGKRPRNVTRDSTAGERARYNTGSDPSEHYVKFEVYPEGTSRIEKLWTAKDLVSGCGAQTVMGLALAETYARDPKFYSGTFCARCRSHFDVGEDGEFIWDDGSGERVGT